MIPETLTIDLSELTKSGTKLVKSIPDFTKSVIFVSEIMDLIFKSLIVNSLILFSVLCVCCGIFTFIVYVLIVIPSSAVTK